MSSWRLVRHLAPHLLLRPRGLVRAARALWRFRARGWWRRPPFLPLPPPEYLTWRLHTAFGEEREPTPGELLRYLEWAVRMGRAPR